MYIFLLKIKIKIVFIFLNEKMDILVLFRFFLNFFTGDSSLAPQKEEKQNINIAYIF